ncbi:WSC domain protein [Apiospora hydei]|uniref:WSC domain protein n=1 Tax=Apiospora hydei TaxID=1337664 RepID=A0ABR1WNJ1_9PEZI
MHRLDDPASNTLLIYPCPLVTPHVVVVQYDADLDPLSGHLRRSCALAGRATRAFSVLRFNNVADKFSTEGRMDPIISPGTASAHSHGVMGGSNFGLTVRGDQLLKSKCTNSMIKNDKSNYWVPGIWYQSPHNGTFKKVPLFYMQVYYFFDVTNDKIEPFPPGLKIVSGEAGSALHPQQAACSSIHPWGPSSRSSSRVPRRAIRTGTPRAPTAHAEAWRTQGTAAPARASPVINCDGYASPLRQDIHLPSCYNPAAGLDDHHNNMAFPSDNRGKLDCPSGWVHVPHMFFEVYYDTPRFAADWRPDGRSQPFVLSDGDRTGYSLHADFVSGWDQDTLRAIIDKCDTGSGGMDTCPTIIGGVNKDDKCVIDSVVPDPKDEWVTALPGDNPLQGWGVGGY